MAADEKTDATKAEDTTQDAAGQSTAGDDEKAEGADTGEQVDGAEALGDKGKKALDAMKAAKKVAEQRARDQQARADALQAKLDGKEAEHAAEQERRRVEAEALSKANGRIVRSEVKAAAKGVLADPADAFKFIDLDQFEVDDDGNVDEDAIAEAVAGLVKSKPYLAAQGGKRFEGGADGGARKETPAKTLAEQIAEAEKSGDFATARRLKAQSLMETANN